MRPSPQLTVTIDVGEEAAVEDGRDVNDVADEWGLT